MEEFGNLSSNVIALGSGGSWFYQLAFDGLIETGNDGQLVNRAIQSWEANSNFSEYTLTVRPGIKFQDGATLTPRDVVNTINRFRTDENESSVRNTLRHIESVTVQDSSTVNIDLERTDFYFPYVLSNSLLRVLPSHIPYSRLTSWEDGGSGPFSMAEHVQSERTMYERFSNYWDGDKPLLDSLEVHYIPSELMRAEALKAGRVDWYSVGDVTQIPGLQAESGIELKGVTTSATRQFVMDNRQSSPFHDKNLRKAIQYAYDRDFVNGAAYFGYGARANDHPVGFSDVYYWHEQPIVERDLSLAEEYLADAGYKNGIDLTLHAMEPGRLLAAALAFKESLLEANIRVEVVLQPIQIYWTEVWMVEPFAASSWAARRAPDSLSLALRSTSSWNESHWHNARLNELLDLASDEYSLERRMGYYRSIQAILIEEVPTTYFAYAPSIVAHQSRLGGVEANPDYFTHVRDWFVEE